MGGFFVLIARVFPNEKKMEQRHFLVEKLTDFLQFGKINFNYDNYFLIKSLDRKF